MKQGLVRLLYNLGKVHGVDITHDNMCSSMLSCFYSHPLSTGRPISSSGQYLKNGLSDLIQIWHLDVTNPQGVLYSLLTVNSH